MLDINKIDFSVKETKTNKSYSLDIKNIEMIAKLADDESKKQNKKVKESQILNKLLMSIREYNNL